MYVRDDSEDATYAAEVMYPDGEWKNTTIFYVHAKSHADAQKKAKNYIEWTSGKEVYRVFSKICLNEPMGFLWKADIWSDDGQFVLDPTIDEPFDEEVHWNWKNEEDVKILHHI